MIHPTVIGKLHDFMLHPSGACSNIAEQPPMRVEDQEMRVSDQVTYL